MVIKRLTKLPSEGQILICLFDVDANNANPTEPCTYSYNEMNISQPTRNIFFRMNLQDENKLKLINIKCNKIKGYTLIWLKPANGNGMKYSGPVCPSDEYILHFLVEGQYNISVNIFLKKQNL